MLALNAGTSELIPKQTRLKCLALHSPFCLHFSNKNTSNKLPP